MNHNRFACSEELPSQYKCTQCDFRANYLVTLRSHCGTEAATDENPYICQNCNFETFSLLISLLHQNKCRNLVGWTPINKSLKLDPELFDQNERIKHPAKEEVRWFQCSSCTFTTKRKYAVQRHVLVRHAKLDELNWMCCDQCSYKTKIAIHLNRHKKQKHVAIDQIKWLHCDQCTYKTKHAQCLKRHKINKHTPNDQIKWFPCEKCPFKSKWLGNLQKHVLSCNLKPEEISWFCCDKCEYTAKKVGYLRLHKLLKHPANGQMEWFQCANCSYKTKTKKLLKSHVLIHLRPEAINWFGCDQCPYKTKYSQDLNAHRKFKHTKKHFDRSQWAYETKTGLGSHLRSEEIKWFDCDECEYKAKRADHLKKHKRARHPPKQML